MKNKWIDAYMDTAERFAQLSSAVKLKVGACVVKDHRIISIGYNGMPAGWSNSCEFAEEDGSLKTKDEVVHAEANAIIKLARDGESGTGATIFCTHAPCIHCAKMIAGAGISQLYYRDTYRLNDGINFLKKSGIEVKQHETKSR
jgi:dCMP deaminase